MGYFMTVKVQLNKPNLKKHTTSISCPKYTTPISFQSQKVSLVNRMRNRYTQAFETNKVLMHLSKDIMILAAMAGVMGDIIRVFSTAYSISKDLSNDEKFTILCRSIADGTLNVIAYWIPYFIYREINGPLMKKILGPNVSEPALEFAKQSLSYVQQSLTFYGIGSALSTHLTNWMVKNQKQLAEYSIMRCLLKPSQYDFSQNNHPINTEHSSLTEQSLVPF